MKRTLQDMIQLTKKKIESTFFKIVKTGDKNNPFIIKEYFGPLKSVKTMMNEGWNRHSYLVDYIDEEYPVFKLSDFKTTTCPCSKTAISSPIHLCISITRFRLLVDSYPTYSQLFIWYMLNSDSSLSLCCQHFHS